MAEFNGMQGTYVKRDAAGLYFMSRKGVWKPMRFPASLDIASLVPGHKYGIELDGRELANLVDLGPNPFFEKNLAEHGASPLPAPAASSFQPLAQTAPRVAFGEGIPLNGLMASATGVVKSALEGTDMTAHDAMLAGLRWARMWGELPPRAEELLSGTDKVLSLKSVQNAAKADAAVEDLNDEIPF